MKKIHDNSAMVMVTVLMAIIVMSTLAVTMLSSHVSQTKSALTLAKEIRANTFAKGVYWKCHEILRSGGDCEDVNDFPDSEKEVTLDGVTYTATISISGTPPCSSADCDVDVDVSWN